MTDANDILSELAEILRQRRQSGDGYSGGLMNKGGEAISRKICEEALEVALAQKGGENKERLVSELADLWFHSLVLMAHNDIDPQELLAELERRRRASETTPAKG